VTATSPWPRRTQFFGVGCFVVFVVVQAVAGPILLFQDSRAYQAVAAHGLFSPTLWVGPRAPLFPIAVMVFGAGHWLQLAQGLSAAVAWTALALVAGRLRPPGWSRTVLVLVVLGFASAFPIRLWDRAALSESWSLSLIAVLVTAALLLAERVRWSAMVLLIAAGALAAGLRDAQLWMAAGCGVACLGFAAVVGRDQGRRVLLLGGCALLAFAALAEVGSAASHRTEANVADVFSIRIFAYPDRVAWFARHGMPEAAAVDRLARGVPPEFGSGPFVDLPSGPRFAPLRHWLAKDATGPYLLFLATHPVYDLTAPLLWPELSYNDAHANPTYYASPLRPLRFPFSTWFWVSPLLVALQLLLAVLLWLDTGAAAWRRRCVAVLGALVVVGAGTFLVAWHGDGQETTRHTVEAATLVRVVAWIAVVDAVDGAIRRRRRRRSEGEQGDAADHDRGGDQPSGSEALVEPPGPDGRAPQHAGLPEG